MMFISAYHIRLWLVANKKFLWFLLKMALYRAMKNVCVQLYTWHLKAASPDHHVFAFYFVSNW